MFTTLRRVRRSLSDLSSNQKYLAYAIGEILLVVLGILIALQINNWNEERLEKRQIKIYLNGLVEALEDDIRYMNYTISGNIFRTECIDQLLLWTRGERSKVIEPLRYEREVTSDYFVNHIGWTNPWLEDMPDAYDREFISECILRTSFGNIVVINQATFEEFKFSGLFSYISEEKLKKMINDYYAKVNWNFSDWRETQYRTRIDQWEDYFRQNHEFNNIDISGMDDPLGFLIKHKDVQLELEDLALDASSRVNISGNIRQSARELIEAIHEHVEQM